MSNDNYWEDEDNLDNESHGSNGDDAMTNLRKAKRADEKRIKELTEQLNSLNKERNERVVKEILASKGVNAKAARLVIKDLDAISEESVSDWLAENGDLIGFQPKQETQVSNADIEALKKQDSVTQSAMAPTYSDDVEQRLANATTEEEILSILNGL